MRLLINGTAYPCIGRPHFSDPVRVNLPQDKPDADSIGALLILQDGEGNELRQIDISGITARRYYDGDYLVITNTPEPVIEEQTEPPDEPTQLDRVEAQTMYTALLTDTLIEEG